jgi:hypothetical protein
MDGMSKELLFWRKESAKYEKKFREETSSFSSNRDDKHQKLNGIIEEQVIILFHILDGKDSDT